MGCEKGGTPVAGNSSGDPQPLVTGGSSEISEDAKSAHFEAVLEKLDLGGELFGYVDIDGDIESLVEAIGGLYDGVSESVPGPDGEQLPDVDVNALLAEFGFHGIEALGLSSYKSSDDFFHNKAFLYIPEGRVGLMKFTGGEPGPISALKLAPTGADIVVEFDVQIRALRDLVDGILGEVNVPDVTDGWNELKEGPFFGMPFTVDEFFEQTNGRASFVAKMVPETPLPKELTNGEEFPSVDALICLENVGWVFDELKEGLTGEEAPFELTEGTEGVKLTMRMPPDTDLGIYEPVILREAGTERVLIATRDAFLKECLSDSNRLTEDAEFKSVTDGLPTAGNGFSYMSAETFATLQSVMDFAMKTAMADSQFENPDNPSAGFEQQFAEWGKSFYGWDRQVGTASITVNLPDGVLFASKDNKSHKAIATIGVVGVAVAASVAVPVYSVVQRRAEMTAGGGETLNQVKMLHLALQFHAIENDGAFPNALEDMNLEEVGLESILISDPLTGQMVKPLYRSGLNNGAPADTAILASPRPGPTGNRVVGFVDGSVKEVPEDEALFLIDGMSQ